MTAEIPPDELMRAKLDGILAYQMGRAAKADPTDEMLAGADPERWWFHRRTLNDGRVVYLMPMLFGNLRLAVSPDAEAQWFDNHVYCYHDHDAAWRAALGWDGEGEPEGWYKHPPTGRRRPDGTPESEFIAP